MTSRKQTRTGEGAKSPRERSLPPHYNNTFTLLFRIENALRIFAYLVLKGAHREGWKNVTLSLPSGGTTSLAAFAKQRERQDTEYGHLGTRVECPLMYLGTTELIKLMLDSGQWEYFRPHFPMGKDTLASKLHEIANIRNALAHFRSVTRGDLQTLRLHCTHSLAGVSKCLSQLTRCSIPFPSSTADDWYSAFRPLLVDDEGESWLRLAQSHDGEWIEIALNDPCMSAWMWGHERTKRDYRMAFLTVDTPRLLTAFPDLQVHLAFASEVMRNWSSSSRETHPTKRVSLLFARSVLAESYPRVIPALVQAVNRIALEYAKDASHFKFQVPDEQRLATRIGQATGTLQRQGGQYLWIHEISDLLSPRPSEPIPEYWPGLHLNITTDFLMQPSNYPWFPAPVSRDPIR